MADREYEIIIRESDGFKSLLDICVPLLSYSNHWFLLDFEALNTGYELTKYAEKKIWIMAFEYSSDSRMFWVTNEIICVKIHPLPMLAFNEMVMAVLIAGGLQKVKLDTEINDSDDSGEEDDDTLQTVDWGGYAES